MSQDSRFPRLVALACHDLRTPLATVHGFARTLVRSDLQEPVDRYVEIIEAASVQLAELLDELSLLARIESGRFEPRLETVDSLLLAREAAEQLEDGTVAVDGEGGLVTVEVDATRRALRQLARAACRHGGLESVSVEVRGAELEISPVTAAAEPVVMGSELRELGAAAAGDLLRALGATVAVADGRLRIRLPEAA
ncbi:MAG TPA: histidine kinase dimerization/phospho-acceptor domain-containing protein [Gaiellaceae bacterium]|nr:histidine kinase dimerization/phospho-acceptor domain-containing protein [Gaiellaceae bacterium]